MLSLLIPTYNYSAHNLVKTLYNQCLDLKVDFEIIVSEDGGHKFVNANNKINELQNCSYIINRKNSGRAGNVNRLLNKAQFSLKLVLDCDVKITSHDFIEKYLNFAQKHEDFACFGGIAYDMSFSDRHSLRYNYGLKREAKNADQRNKNPYKNFLTSNILLKNCNQTFDERITKYGFEDLVFSENLKSKGESIFHIDNPVIHENTERNEVFISKIETGLKTLIYLEKNNIVDTGKNKISKIYHSFSRLGLQKILIFLSEVFQKPIYDHVQKNGKPLWLFDLHRLLYFSKHY
jgi:GT2 family glycosyltransferase